MSALTEARDLVHELIWYGESHTVLDALQAALARAEDEKRALVEALRGLLSVDVPEERDRFGDSYGCWYCGADRAIVTRPIPHYVDCEWRQAKVTLAPFEEEVHES